MVSPQAQLFEVHRQISKLDSSLTVLTRVLSANTTVAVLANSQQSANTQLTNDTASSFRTVDGEVFMGDFTAWKRDSDSNNDESSGSIIPTTSSRA